MPSSSSCPRLQIHDELVFEVREDVLPHAARLVKHVMEVRAAPYLHLQQPGRAAQMFSAVQALHGCPGSAVSRNFAAAYVTSTKEGGTALAACIQL